MPQGSRNDPYRLPFVRPARHMRVAYAWTSAGRFHFAEVKRDLWVSVDATPTRDQHAAVVRLCRAKAPPEARTTLWLLEHVPDVTFRRQAPKPPRADPDATVKLIRFDAAARIEVEDTRLTEAEWNARRSFKQGGLPL